MKTIEPVVRTVTVKAGRERAFEVFTAGFASWWPEHFIGDGDWVGAYIEPREGGRWYERTTAGEADWGVVLAWEPPARIALSWHLDGDWAYDPDPAHASRVEVTFAEVPDGTRVTLEHSGLDRARGGGSIRDQVGADGGWAGILRGYAETSAEPTGGIAAT